VLPSSPAIAGHPSGVSSAPHTRGARRTDSARPRLDLSAAPYSKNFSWTVCQAGRCSRRSGPASSRPPARPAGGARKRTPAGTGGAPSAGSGRRRPGTRWRASPPRHPSETLGPSQAARHRLLLWNPPPRAPPPHRAGLRGPARARILIEQRGFSMFSRLYGGCIEAVWC
jgi:hypothetical protein